MSRETVSGTGTSTATTPTSNDLHLIIGHGPSGPVLSVNTTPVLNSIRMTRRDYHAFLFYMLQIFSLITLRSIRTNVNATNTPCEENTPPPYKKNTPPPYEKIAQQADLFKEIGFFLYAHIARLVAPGLSEHEQLECTARALYASNVTIPPTYCAIQRPIQEKPGMLTSAFDPAKWGMLNRTFFGMSVAQRITASPSHQLLLNHALNAVENLDEIRTILNNTRLEELPILLSVKGTATITHLETLNPPHTFTRTGTALQMAIYGDDEGVQALLKEYMDPEEFERQAIEAFSTVLPLDVKQRLAEEHASAAEYQQLADTQQKADAKNLCAELEAAMHAADPTEFPRTGFDYLLSTTPGLAPASATAAAVQFKQDLLDYTQKNPLHNRYILERLHKINASLEKESYSFGRDCFLSQQGIAEAQLLMSMRWVQHYACGAFHLAENKDELALRTSACYDTDPPLDIHTVMSRLRSDCLCLDGYAAGTERVLTTASICSPARVAAALSNLMSCKNTMQLELVMPRAQQASARKPRYRCVIS